ncbi:MAG: hypothetical protein ACYDCO_01840 [Armatimonadota bacterium]
MMELRCYHCGVVVSTVVPDTTVLRAICVCPECIESGRDESEQLAALRERVEQAERATRRAEGELRLERDASNDLMATAQELIVAVLGDAAEEHDDDSFDLQEAVQDAITAHAELRERVKQAEGALATARNLTRAVLLGVDPCCGCTAQDVRCEEGCVWGGPTSEMDDSVDREEMGNKLREILAALSAPPASEERVQRVVEAARWILNYMIPISANVRLMSQEQISMLITTLRDAFAEHDALRAGEEGG